MELLWDTVEVLAEMGLVLTLIFPPFVATFIELRQRYSQKLPSHRTMIVYILVAISGGFSYVTEGAWRYWNSQQESYIYLGSLFKSQQDYFAEYNTYAGRTGRNGDGAPLPTVSQNAFTCVAIGDIDNDDTFDVWSINDGEKRDNKKMRGRKRRWLSDDHGRRKRRRPVSRTHDSGVDGTPRRGSMVNLAIHEVDDSGDDGTRTRGSLTFKGRLYLEHPHGGIYFDFLGMVTPFLLLSIAIDIARALRLRREAIGGD